MNAPDIGPYETEREARRGAHAVVAPEGDRITLSFDQNREVLRRVLAECGVRVSEFEARTVHWLGGWEDYQVGVIAGWMLRAASHGMSRPAAFDIAGDYEARFVLTQALEHWEAVQLEASRFEGGNPQREQWASRANAMLAAIKAAMDEPQGPAAEGEAKS